LSMLHLNVALSDAGEQAKVSATHIILEVRSGTAPGQIVKQ
jgi:hypothetical protein